VFPKPKARRRCTPAPSRVGLERTKRFTGRMDMTTSPAKVCSVAVETSILLGECGECWMNGRAVGVWSWPVQGRASPFIKLWNSISLAYGSVGPNLRSVAVPPQTLRALAAFDRAVLILVRCPAVETSASFLYFSGKRAAMNSAARLAAGGSRFANAAIT
jgi:hypothetical protein